MADPTGETISGPLRLDFDRRRPRRHEGALGSKGANRRWEKCVLMKAKPPVPTPAARQHIASAAGNARLRTKLVADIISVQIDGEGVKARVTTITYPPPVNHVSASEA